MTRPIALLVLLFAALFPATLVGAKIGDLAELDWQEQALRFLSLQDPAVRYALAGSLLLGLSCGVLGAFLLVRKLSLVGDTLSHAVLPGVALGFLWSGSKDSIAIFLGATIAGLLGTWVFHSIRRTTPIKEDASLGLVLAGFYGVGVLLLSIIQGLDLPNKGGLDRYLFGQAAALGGQDVLLMGVVAVAAVTLIAVFYRPLLATAFDSGFAGSLGLPTPVLFGAIMLLLSFAVVVALKAVGVVLVSAMLVIPPATAFLLTDRFARMITLAAVFGMVGAGAGAFVSFLAPSLPTGPFMVVASAILFVVVFLGSPRHGLLPRLLRIRNRRARIARENLLSVIYRIREKDGFPENPISLARVATARRETLAETIREIEGLVQQDRAAWTDAPGERHQFTLTDQGWLEATRIVRNHRLWELYLTHAADYPSDHVHEDAEIIEHVLGEETVRHLERRLNFPRFDPHGKPIPGLEDLGILPEPTPATATGYGRANQPGIENR